MLLMNIWSVKWSGEFQKIMQLLEGSSDKTADWLLYRSVVDEPKSDRWDLLNCAELPAAVRTNMSFINFCPRRENWGRRIQQRRGHFTLKSIHLYSMCIQSTYRGYFKTIACHFLNLLHECMNMFVFRIISYLTLPRDNSIHVFINLLYHVVDLPTGHCYPPLRSSYWEGDLQVKCSDSACVCLDLCDRPALQK